MKKFLSPYYTKFTHHIAALILRICLGGVMVMGHGITKLIHFSEIHPKFMDFMGIGTQASLGLAVFAEFFCALFVVLGLFTRLAVIPLIFLFLVILIKVKGFDIFGTGQLPFILLAGFTAILFMGPGKISIDGLISKR